MPSLYICVFGLITILTIITLIKKEWDTVCYYIGFFVLTVFLCLRFGQGTDYPSYWSIYQHAEVALEQGMGFWKYWCMTGGEIGWHLFMVLFKALHMDYRFVIVIVSVIMMLCTHKSIVRFCPIYKTMSLVLLYPTIYLTYYFSGLRQGLSMAVFFGILFGFLLDKKIVRYIIGVILLATIHLASLIYLIVPIALCLKKRVYIFGTIASILFAVCMYWEPLRNVVIYIAGHFGKAANYFGAVSISIFSLLERIGMMIIILLLWWRSTKDNNKNNEVKESILKIYYMGFLIYICLCTNPLVASRLAIMFKMAEFILIPMLLEDVEDIVRKGCMLLLCAVCGLMMYKNMNSYAAQGNYRQGISGWNYPYVTVFNYEKILDYREGFVYEPFEFIEEEYIRSGEF